MDAAAKTEDERQARIGFAFGLAAYLIWGLVPLYFKQVDQINVFEIVAHRIVWSPPLLILVLALRRQIGGLLLILGKPRIMAALAASSIVIAINWLGYIYAVTSHQIVAASLGYFLNPIVNVAIGMLVLKERLALWQAIAVALAAVGVTILALSAMAGLWISLTVAFSFAFYGLIRKLTPVGSIEGLAVETLILTLPSLGCLLWLSRQGSLGFGADGVTDFLLIFGSVVTAVPLMMFAVAARRLRLVALGLLQYIAPTAQFLIGVFLYGEPLSAAQLVSFGFIWAGLVLYSLDSARPGRPPPR